MSEIGRGDEVSRGDDDRPSLAALRERVDAGESVYDVVGEVLTSDAQSLGEYRRRYFKAIDLNQAPPSLSGDLNDLYEFDLIPGSAGDIRKTILQVDFRAGFTHLAGIIYPEVREAALSGSINPQGGAATDEEVLRGMVIANARESLQTDRSGVTWLNERIETDLRGRGLMLAGAKHAAIGAGKLYEQLTAPPAN